MGHRDTKSIKNPVGWIDTFKNTFKQRISNVISSVATNEKGGHMTLIQLIIPGKQINVLCNLSTARNN